MNLMQSLALSTQWSVQRC